MVMTVDKTMTGLNIHHMSEFASSSVRRSDSLIYFWLDERELREGGRERETEPRHAVKCKISTSS